MRDESTQAQEREPHWPGMVALFAAASLNIFLPPALAAGPGWLGALLVAILASLTLMLPDWHRPLGHATTALVTLELAFALVRLIADLAGHRGVPLELLQGALILWSMNVVVFASWYWRLDAGGPHHRSRRGVYIGGSFLFPQVTLSADARAATGTDRWRPAFVDYLFLAFNTSTAFSPTDVPVLSAWAKVLMMIQASISLATVVMVAARAVNIL
ncbi:MAG: hypothetical protein IT163_19805 [Bryobacterales bacterium]|nr:hypothetical protein [Bryobacterales bacterium]